MCGVPEPLRATRKTPLTWRKQRYGIQTPVAKLSISWKRGVNCEKAKRTSSD